MDKHTLRPLIAFFALFIPLSVHAAAFAPLGSAQPPRQRLLMDFGWRFHLGDAPDAGQQFVYPEFTRLDKNRPDDAQQEALIAPTRQDPAATHLGESVSFVQPDYDDSGWRKLNLPHDWAVELPFDRHADPSHGFKALGPQFGTNIGWYRRAFFLPTADRGAALRLEFDGVYRNSVVWLNGHCLGRNPSGYVGFSYNIQKEMNCGGRNVLVVRVDATRTEGWWYEGAGIYRHVWLVKTGLMHVARWGTFVTSRLHGNMAEETVQTTLKNDSAQPEACQLVSTILNAQGRQVAQSTQTSALFPPGQAAILTQSLPVKFPVLWSLGHPSLYTLVSKVVQDGKMQDQYRTPFGIRTIRFDPNHGFFLNGKHVLIKGTCNHQDFAGVGVAVPDRLEYDRVQKLKAMGCNAWRMSHNPSNPELLDDCDRLGMLVLDENRRMGTTPEITHELTGMLLRDRNHPSIILWGIGNEEMSVQGSDAAAHAVALPMQTLVHTLDPTRPVTEAMNWDWGKGVSKIIDVQGFNYLGNAIRGRKLAELGSKRGFMDMDQFHEAFPNTPAVGTEEGSVEGVRGVYTEERARGYLSAYDVDQNLPKGGNYTDLLRGDWASTAEHWVPYYAARPWVAGAFVWTGFDYRGEPTPFSWPNISSQFGIMDTCGFPKDSYYYYQSVWGDKSVVHILPDWNWPGQEGKPIDVWVYSNASRVGLSLNGKSLGVQAMPPMGHAEWSVPYAPGTLVATGYRNGKAIATDTVQTTGAPAHLVLSPDRKTIHADGEDVALVTVSAVDSQGRSVPTAQNFVTFHIQGSGQILGVGNGDPTCHEPDKGTARSLFNGLALVIVQADRHSGPIRLTADANGLAPATLTLQAKPSPLRPAVP